MNETPKPVPPEDSPHQASHKRHKAAMNAKAEERQARLKAALRDNLRRRKASDHKD